MQHNFKYLAHNIDDRNWGIYMTVFGSARVEPRSEYPPLGHPNGYHFNWQNGRVLQEYQINYITDGEGMLETREGKHAVREGSVILLKPDMWHRYRPDKNTGWTEHYVGFAGDVAERMIKSTVVLNESPVLHVGYHEEILQDLQEISNFAQTEKPGYHQVCSGLVIHIIGQIISLKKSENFRFSNVEKTIQKACLIIRDNPARNLVVEELAEELGINYSLFRKAFKKYTGLSPMQYHTSLRLKQAIYLLTNTDQSIKEISFNLGFCSVFYFSKLFKEKTGTPPGSYRNNNRFGH